jgi:hypothetical protein
MTAACEGAHVEIIGLVSPNAAVANIEHKAFVINYLYL